MSIFQKIKSFFVSKDIDIEDIDNWYEEDNSKLLFGYDLDIWNYLGQTVISYLSSGKAISTANIAFFVKKDDENCRSFIILGNDKTIEEYEYHGWISGMAKPWEFGEHELFQVVQSIPSKYLTEYMKDKYSVYWDNKEKWWVKQQQYSDTDNIVDFTFKKGKKNA